MGPKFVEFWNYSVSSEIHILKQEEKLELSQKMYIPIWAWSLELYYSESEVSEHSKTIQKGICST